MADIAFTVPEETILALHATPTQAAQEVRLAAAMKLYELGKLSSGAAAALAGMPRVVFLSRLAEYGVVAFQQTAEELRRDVEGA